MLAQSDAQSGAQSSAQRAQELHTQCVPPVGGDILCSGVRGFVHKDENNSQMRIVSNENQSPVIDLARRLRLRFGQGVRLTYHATPEQTQGRKPYWWGALDV